MLQFCLLLLVFGVDGQELLEAAGRTPEDVCDLREVLCGRDGATAQRLVAVIRHQIHDLRTIDLSTIEPGHDVVRTIVREYAQAISDLLLPAGPIDVDLLVADVAVLVLGGHQLVFAQRTKRGAVGQSGTGVASGAVGHHADSLLGWHQLFGWWSMLTRLLLKPLRSNSEARTPAMYSALPVSDP